MQNFLLKSFVFLSACALIPLGCSENRFQEGSVQVTQTKPKPEVHVLPSVEAAQPLRSKARRTTATYPASVLMEESVAFTLDTQEMSTQFTLRDVVAPLTEEHQQLSRRIYTESFTQGRPELEQYESFTQRGRKGAVDILLVIDNSLSMKEEQLNLSDKMHELIASLSESDWQIGIITTSPLIVDGKPQCEMKVVKSSDPDPASMFQEAILAGTGGNRVEYGFLQAVVGLSCSTAPWVRSNSTLAVLIVSDEDNCSDQGRECPGDASENESYLIDYVEKEMGREVGKNAGFYGIFSPPSAPCRTSPNTGIQYQRLVDYKSQGLSNYGNICDASYKNTLNRISDNIALLLPAEFGLSKEPVPGSVRLEVVDAAGQIQSVAAEAYQISGSTINFFAGQEPPHSATLRARYRIPGLPMFEQLKLAAEPAPNTLRVSINGQELPAEAFHLEEKKLQFSQQPEPLATVSVEYRENSPLRERFRLQAAPLAESLAVEVNGEPTRAFRYQAETEMLEWTEVPSDGATIRVAYNYRAGPELQYALPLAEGSRHYQLFDGEEELNFSEENGIFTIPAAAHEEGKVLTLRYESPDWSQKTFSLAHLPVEDGAQIEGGQGLCALGKGSELLGSELLVRCGVASRTEFVLRYKYRVPQRSFNLPGITDPERGTWEVFADRKPIQEFIRSGSQVKLTYEPSDETELTVQYTWPQ